MGGEEQGTGETISANTATGILMMSWSEVIAEQMLSSVIAYHTGPSQAASLQPWLLVSHYVESIPVQELLATS